MKLYKEQNIKKIIQAIELDEYDDTIQDQAIEQEDFIPDVQTFLDLFIKHGKVLEIGCGSGDSLGKFGINHGIEPCEKRFKKALEKSVKLGLDKNSILKNVSECIEFPAKTFDTILMINGFFQVRSDYESLIEINTALKIGGMFILNLLVNDEIDIVLGRCLGPKNYIRLLNQFGFELKSSHTCNAGKRFYPDSQETTIICVEKVRDFNNKFLNLPQIMGKKNINNFIIERDWRLI